MVIHSGFFHTAVRRDVPLQSKGYPQSTGRPSVGLPAFIKVLICLGPQRIGMWISPARPATIGVYFVVPPFQSLGISVSVELWQQCVDLLRDELPSQQFNTWIRPLQVEAEGDELRVYAPNRFVLDWVNEKYLGRLLELLGERGEGQLPALSLLIGSKRSRTPRAAIVPSQTHVAPRLRLLRRRRQCSRYRPRPWWCHVKSCRQ